MGQALRKVKPPSRAAPTSETAVPTVKGLSLDIKPAHPEPKVIIEAQQHPQELNRPDPTFAAMSKQVMGLITSRPAGKFEHPTATVNKEYSRPMPSDRHTTIFSGPSEDTIQSPGTLNHTHVRELFLLYQGKAEGQENPLDVECLAKRFNVDAEILQRVFRHTSLVHFSISDQNTRGNLQQTEDNAFKN